MLFLKKRLKQHCKNLCFGPTLCPKMYKLRGCWRKTIKKHCKHFFEACSISLQRTEPKNLRCGRPPTRSGVNTQTALSLGCQNVSSDPGLSNSSGTDDARGGRGRRPDRHAGMEGHLCLEQPDQNHGKVKEKKRYQKPWCPKTLENRYQKLKCFGPKLFHVTLMWRLFSKASPRRVVVLLRWLGCSPPWWGWVPSAEATCCVGVLRQFPPCFSWICWNKIVEIGWQRLALLEVGKVGTGQTFGLRLSSRKKNYEVYQSQISSVVLSAQGAALQSPLLPFLFLRNPRKCVRQALWTLNICQGAAAFKGIEPNIGHWIWDGKALSSILVTELGIVRLVKELQSAKALSSIRVTELGIVRHVKELQSAKALSSIRATELGIVRLLKELQSAKAKLPIPVTELGIVRLVKELHPAKALFSIRVTELGIVRLLKELQSAKAKLPIPVTELGIVRLVKELQPTKALCPIWVTESGMTTASKSTQPQKACCSIPVAPSGIRTSSSSSWPDSLAARALSYSMAGFMENTTCDAVTKPTFSHAHCRIWLSCPGI